MNKFLKVLTLAGLTTTLSLTGFSMTNLKLNTNFKLNTEIDTEASDYVGRKDEDTSLSSAESQNDEVVNQENSTIDENSANITPSTLEENNETEITPKTLEETETDIEINDDENNNSTENFIPEDKTNNTDEDKSTENSNNSLEQTETFISEEDFNLIITSYDELKEEIEELIEKSKNIADNSKNYQNLLSAEQKLNIQNKTDEINTLIMNVKENIKDITCTLTGDCEELNDEIKEYYFNEILRLNNKVNMLQSAMQMYSNPMFRFYQSPYSNIYGFSYYYSPNQDSQEDNTEDANLENASDDNSQGEDAINKNTFNLPNNLDTYGPTRRNIDTFFNTALLDNDNVFNGYGPYGYNMPYNNFAYGGYGMNGFGEYNTSNYINKNAVTENVQSTTPLSVDSSNNSNQPVLPEEIGKKRPKFAKNIDTYTGKTFDGNVNSMTGMKITDYLKQKFNKWFNKKENQEEVNKYVDNFIDEHQNIEDKQINSLGKIDNELTNKENQKNYF